VPQPFVTGGSGVGVIVGVGARGVAVLVGVLVEVGTARVAVTVGTGTSVGSDGVGVQATRMDRRERRTRDNVERYCFVAIGSPIEKGYSSHRVEH